MAILETRQLTRRFGGLKAVNGISMQASSGEILGIIGPNGAGKTTFFNLITATLPASEGQILFEGTDITHMNCEQVARLGIARTFQNIKLFRQLSVLENVKVGFHIRGRSGVLDALVHTPRYRREEQEAEEGALRILSRVSLLERQDWLAGNLPYGLQRRLEIARALALSPRLLLLDEPAAGMNPSETESLLDFVRTLRDQGITIIVIEHDMKFIMRLCDRILVINAGEKLAEGTPQEISRNPAVIEAYLGSGLSIERRPAHGIS